MTPVTVAKRRHCTDGAGESRLQNVEHELRDSRILSLVYPDEEPPPPSGDDGGR
jgi:hypothetical protein